MAEIKDVVVPDIGDFDEVDVIEILVSVGDVVAIDDSLITIESDKASMEVPSTVSGVVREIAVELGDKVGEGAVIVRIEEQASAESERGSVGDLAATVRVESQKEETRKEETQKVETQKVESATTAPSGADSAPAAPGLSRGGEDASGPIRRSHPEQPDSSATEADAAEMPVVRSPRRGLVHASPSVRRFARELGVDLEPVSGSGPKGRILKEDVQAFVKTSLGMKKPSPADGGPGAPGPGIPRVPTIDFSKFGEIEHRPLSRIRRVSAQNLHRSWLNVPHVTQFDEADVTDLEDFRKSLKQAAEKRGVKLTPLAFMMKAVVTALQEFPTLNASLDESGEALIVKRYYHLGIAVDTPDGLVVPAIRDVDKKGVFELAEELGEVSERARNGKLTMTDIQGAGFSISSLGGIGGTNFTPIVNAPEVAILGVARMQMKPLFQGGEFVPRKILPLCLSYDHRVIDGAEGARFTTFLSKVLGDIRHSLL